MPLFNPAATTLTISGPVSVNQGTPGADTDAAAWTVQLPPLPPTTGSIIANGQSITQTLSGRTETAVQISGTWVGTITFEVTTDGTNYVNTWGIDVATKEAWDYSQTTGKIYKFPVGGHTAFRCRSTAWTSGTASITILSTVFTSVELGIASGTQTVTGNIIAAQGAKTALNLAWPMVITDQFGSTPVGLTGQSLNVAPGYQSADDDGISGSNATVGGEDAGVARALQMRATFPGDLDYGAIVRPVGSAVDGESIVTFLQVGGQETAGGRARAFQTKASDPSGSENALLVRNYPGNTLQRSSIYDSTGSNALSISGVGAALVAVSSLPLPSGAATETTLAKLPVAQGSTTSGQSNILNGAAVLTAAPTYTTAQTSPLSLTTTGHLRTHPENIGTVGSSASTGPALVGFTDSASKMLIPWVTTGSPGASDNALVTINRGTIIVNTNGSIVRTQSYDQHTQSVGSGPVASGLAAAAVTSILHMWHPSTVGVNWRITQVTVSFAGGTVAAGVAVNTVYGTRTTANGTGAGVALVSYDAGYVVSANSVWAIAQNPGPTRIATNMQSAVMNSTATGSLILYQQDPAMQSEGLRCRSGVGEGYEVRVVSDPATAQVIAQQFSVTIEYVEN